MSFPAWSLKWITDLDLRAYALSSIDVRAVSTKDAWSKSLPLKLEACPEFVLFALSVLFSTTGSSNIPPSYTKPWKNCSLKTRLSFQTKKEEPNKPVSL